MIFDYKNPNLIQVPEVRIGCFKKEFDSTYPLRLNGIVGQDEFQESISNVNRAIASRKCLFIGCCSTRKSRIRQALANESIKYSTRSPKSCIWRYDLFKIGKTASRIRFVHRLVIEISNPGDPIGGGKSYRSNQVAPQSTSVFPQQNNIPLPPQYNSQANTGFCTQCGMQRQNFTSKFCSSCGQQFNI